MSEIVLSSLDRGRSVTVAVGDAITIRLDENPTTGYLWQVEEPPRAVVRVDRSELSFARGGVGAGGVRVVRLEVVEQGSQVLRLDLRRPWDADDRIDRFELEVVAVEG